MLELKRLSKSYFKDNHEFKALVDLDLIVHPGEIVGLIGHSGAGKSTLVRCVDLLETLSSGEIWLNGTRVDHLKGKKQRQARRQIGMIFQGFHLLNTKTVFDNIALPLRLIKKDDASIQKEVMRLLDYVGLTDKAFHYPMQLSGGQKQRVAIARALITNPALLLLDEATSALDPQTTISILELVKQIQAEENRAILMITHDMNAAKRCCDRIYILHNGRIVESNDVVHIFANPKHPETKQLVQEQLYQLPSEYEHLSSTPLSEKSACVIAVEFFGQQTYEPIISNLLYEYYPDVKVNILQGKIEPLHNDLFGLLVLELQGKTERFSNAIDYLRERHLIVNVLGYHTK